MFVPLPAVSRHSTFAQESLAGLAAKVDFSAVRLGGRRAGAGRLLPYRAQPMLLRVKGRRHVQTRLVPPATQALNAGDCFVLVSRDEVHGWGPGAGFRDEVHGWRPKSLYQGTFRVPKSPQSDTL